MKKLLFILMFTVISVTGFAQSNVLDGVYVKEHTSERKVTPYTYLREADVMWSRRIWRKVDLREKINHILYYPNGAIPDRKSLMQIVYDGITKDGLLIPYQDDNEGDFTNVLTRDQVTEKLNRIDTIPVEDPNTGEITNKIVPNMFDPSKVKEIKIKEDWFFDKQRSVLDCRIIGIAPVMEEEKNGEMRKSTLFWIYFPEARIVFSTSEVYNRQNDAERRTLDDVFWKRQFSSYIYKESNVYDRKIMEYKTGMDALIEAERAKMDIFHLEHDLWEF
jgi:gliding motility associated protien GldN